MTGAARPGRGAAVFRVGEGTIVNVSSHQARQAFPG